MVACLRWHLALCLFGGAMVLGGCESDSRTPGTSCDPACSAGTRCCDDRCVVVNSDPSNCGACGATCSPGQTCISGTCQGMAIDAGPRADTGPVTPGVDAGPISGDCTPSCSSSQRCCGTCVNRSAPAGSLEARSDSSFGHCNGCGIACDPERATVCGSMVGASGPPQCLCGNFAQCAPGQACVMQGSSYICSDLNSDPNNCGEVGNTCNEGESCVAGSCGCGSGAPCAEGQACCAGESGASCVDVSSDPMNCGGCGIPCTPNAPDCNSGTCGCGTGAPCVAPVAGSIFPPADGMLGQSCCAGTCVDNSNSNCLCEACTAPETCQVGGSGFSLPIPGMMGGEEEIPTVCCAEDSSGDPFGGACGGGGFPFPFP